MRIDPAHLVPADQAAAALPALLQAAASGRASHFVADQRVVADLIPPNTLVVTADVEDLLLRPAIRSEALRLAAEIESGGYQHAGNTVGGLLAWLWESSDDAAIRWTAAYATELADALAARRVARPPFGPFWKSVSTALAAVLTDDDVREFESEVRGRLAGLTDVFSAAELAGDDRARDVDDPWPDVTARGRCFAKKRWSDVRVGDFIPSGADADLDYDDVWCRIEELDDQRMVLRDADGQSATRPVGETTAWWPVRGREPWQWGLPLDRR